MAAAADVAAAGEEEGILRCCGQGSCGSASSSCPGTLSCSDGTSKHAQSPGGMIA